MALAQLWAGRILSGTGRRDQAIARYQKALEITPNLPGARQELRALRRVPGSPPRRRRIHREALWKQFARGIRLQPQQRANESSATIGMNGAL